MKQFKTLKRIWSLFLTLSMVVAMGVVSLPAYAATGGTISVKYEPNDVTITEPTQFELYKVGTFGRFDDGTVSINLTDAFATCGISLNGIAPPKEGASQQEIEDWNNAWLAKASDLESWIKGVKDKPATVWDGTLASGSTPQTLTEGGAAKHFDNGIYLLIGYEQKVGEYYWAPVPVLIMVLNNDVTFELVDSASKKVIKTVNRPVAYKHVLKKIWEDEGHKDARPDKIYVDILYGITDPATIDTVTLSEENDWTYIWYSQEADVDRYYASKGVETTVLNKDNGYKIELPPGDGVWNVSEQQTDDLKYYSWSLKHESYKDYKTASQQTSGSGQEPAEGSGDAEPAEGSGDGTPAEGETVEPEKPDADYIEYFNLTNKFETKRVRIKKHLINYLNHNDGDEAYANATVVFDVKGYIGTSTKPVYENQVGMTFTKPGNQEIVLNNIPVKVTRVVAKEIYNTNYEEVNKNYEITRDITDVDDPTTVPGVVIEKDSIGEGKTIDCITFIFEFENDYKGPPKYGSGIVNKYDKNDKGEYEYEPYPDTSDIFPPTQS